MTEAHTTTNRLPYLTTELPGVGGVTKRYDEDFVVEEMPLYEASGTGTHTYFLIEKQGVTTLAAIQIIARELRRQPRDIGYAGMKDAHGVTRQMLSIEHVAPEQIESLALSRIRIISTGVHTNKIKLGHLAGNRFVIKVRDAVQSPQARAEAIVEVLSARGVPNYFGPQRFGVRGDNAAVGRAVLRDDYDEAIALMLGRPGRHDSSDARRARELFDAGDLEASAAAWPRSLSSQGRVCRALIHADGDAQKAWHAVDHTLRKLYVSAVQSEMFNLVLARRIQGLDKLEAGDVAWKHKNGAAFLVEDAALEQPRCDSFEISPTGPLFGRKMKEPAGSPAAEEADVLQASGLSGSDMRIKDGTKLDGARRPLRVPLGEPAAESGEDDRGAYLQLSFALPPGAYATNVVREICKNPADA